jgi:hypothetical protein
MRPQKSEETEWVKLNIIEGEKNNKTIFFEQVMQKIKIVVEYIVAFKTHFK